MAESAPAGGAVAITGIGVICALGSTRDAVLAGLRAGARPFARVRRFDAGAFKVDLAAEVPSFDFAGRFGRAAARHTSRTDRLAAWAADDAVAQAGLAGAPLPRTAVFVGASSGGMQEMEATLAAGATPHLGTYWSYPVWAAARHLSQRLGVDGPPSTVMTACSSAAHALGAALGRLRRGDLDIAIAGGAESLCRLTLAGFGSLGVLDPAGSRPFATGRAGITLGEGAAFFVLERPERAAARGARPLAFLAGYGASADAHHMVHPKDDGDGARAAMTAALADAGLAAADVDVVNAHGTGTVQNDAMEARAIAALVGGRGVAVSSCKSMVGHTLGAAAAVEAALAVLAMNDGVVPPNAGVSPGEALEELAGARLVTAAERRPTRVVLSSSFAFGGNNAALVLTAADDAGVGPAVGAGASAGAGAEARAGASAGAAADARAGASAGVAAAGPPAVGRRGASMAAPADRAETDGVVISGAAVSCAAGTAHDAPGIAALLEDGPATKTGDRAAADLPDGGTTPAAATAKDPAGPGAPFPGLDPAALFGAARVRRIDPLSAATAAVCALACQSAGAEPGPDLALGFGTSFGALDGTAKFLERFFQKGPRLVNPLEFPNLVHNAAAGHASILLGAAGPSVTACSEELAADEAFAEMTHCVIRRRAPRAVSAGGDLASGHLDAGYGAARRLFDLPAAHHSVVGAVYLEPPAAAAARGSAPWARVLASAGAGRGAGVGAAVGRALEAAFGEGPAAIDLWLTGAVVPAQDALEDAAAALPALAAARRVPARRRLGTAGGAGAAVIAAGAAAVATGAARVALITSVTYDGASWATLLGAPE